MLEKTNERVSLDRNFLIKEKMRVIMVEAEKAERKKADKILNKRNLIKLKSTEVRRNRSKQMDRNSDLSTIRSINDYQNDSDTVSDSMIKFPESQNKPEKDEDEKEGYDYGPQKILNEIKTARLKKNRD